MKKRNIVLTIIASFYLFAAIFGVNMVANAAAVTIESKHLVRNASRNEVNYMPTTTAQAGDTLRYMVWYHNTQNENSGLNGTNINVSVSIPTTASNSHVTTATVTGGNTNTVSQTTQVSTATQTTLEYVPGTATRRYNAGTNASPSWVTVGIPDTIVNGGYVIPVLQPCWNFEESIVFTVRVVPSIPQPVLPTCTMSATQANSEGSVNLAYTTTNAFSATITNIGSVPVGSGNRTVSPRVNTTYTLTATGEGGTAVCSAIVNVTERPTPNPPVVITGKGNPLPVSGPAEAAAGAAGLTITGGAGYAWLKSKKALLSALTKIK